MPWLSLIVLLISDALRAILKLPDAVWGKISNKRPIALAASLFGIFVVFSAFGYLVGVVLWGVITACKAIFG